MTRWPSGKISIRALTYHTPIKEDDITSLNLILEDKLSLFNDKIDMLMKNEKIRVLTKRLVLNNIRQKYLEKTLSILQELAETYNIDYYAIPLSHIDNIQSLIAAFQEYPGFFTSIQYTREIADNLIELLQKFAEHTWIGATHFAVSFGELLVTPYFPATTAMVEGITASLLYPSYFIEKIGGIEGVYNDLGLIYHILESTLPHFLGIDYSLSPWMDESVAKVIEYVGGAMFTLPGTIDAIVKINKVLEGVSSKLGGIGYNEIMLPLGEDNRLKELAREGQLRFSHLLNYTAYCVAGLDMVPIPSTVERKVLEGVFRDLETIHLLKSKTIGMRLIPVGFEEGEEVDLGIFGRVPVLSPIL